MNRYFYVDANKQKAGPVSPEEFHKIRITDETLVWTKGMAKWTKAGNIPELAVFMSKQKEEEESPNVTSSPKEPVSHNNDALNRKSTTFLSSTDSEKSPLPQQKISGNETLSHIGYNSAYNKKNDNHIIAIAIIIAIAVVAIATIAFFVFRSSNKEVPEKLESSQVSEETFMPRSEYDFSGYINNQYPITGHLNRDTDGNLSGYYYYNITMKKYGNRPSTYIRFSGNIDSSGHIEMIASFHNGQAESWYGNLNENELGFSFDGYFYGTDGTYFTASFSNAY